MEKKEIEQALNIRYMKLHFTIQFVEDTVLPKNKVSALRGGMGQMLLRLNCIRDRNCDFCDFESECIVRRMMYSQLSQKPDYMKQGDSLGYVFECDNYEESFYAGDELRFNLILLGKNIVYFQQYLQAFTYLGIEGIGKNHSKFIILQITNSKNKVIYEDNRVYMENYTIQKVIEYVDYRMKMNRNEHTIIFPAPLTVKYRGEFIREFNMDAIVAAIIRRIHMLDCFEDLELASLEKPDLIPNWNSIEVIDTYVNRYSSTHDDRVKLRGIRGSMYIQELDENLKMLLLAGELIHIGKNTSFGFGKYTLVE